jgi:hypothetical protein
VEKRAKKNKKRKKLLCKVTQKESWKSLIHTKNQAVALNQLPITVVVQKAIFSHVLSLHIHILHIAMM